MAPRRRSTTSATPSGLGLHSLPDEAIVHCLSFVTPEDRLGSVAVVNKRLRQLCLAPELLRDVTFTATCTCSQALPRLQALQQLLCGHGQHVRSLQLAVTITDENTTGCISELEALVAGCLVACGAAACALEALELGNSTPLVSTAWLPQLSSLTSLTFGSVHQPLRPPFSISRLSALQELAVSGCPVKLPAGTQLPSSLTWLHVADQGGKVLPQQFTSLTNLVTLELLGTQYSDASMESLRQMPSLRKLGLIDGQEAPTCLPALTQLCQLELDASEAGSFSPDVVDATLRQLRQLTCLGISAADVESLPVSIKQLQKLQRLWFYGGGSDSLALPQEVSNGPWLASLRWLGLPWEGILSRIDLLRQMPALEYLCSLGLPRMARSSTAGANARDQRRWAEFWEFAATHPVLRCLGIDPLSGDTEPSEQTSLELLDALLDLKQQRPALHIRRMWRHDRGGGTFWDEMLLFDAVPTAFQAL